MWPDTHQHPDWQPQDDLPHAPDHAGTWTGRHPLRVLLADDHPLMREGLHALLSDDDSLRVVGEAEDGAAAIELTRRLHPDVILMDVAMPRMNGLDATRRIREEFPGVRVVALSMHEAQDMAEAMQRAGAAAYLAKGCPLEALLAAIRGEAPCDPVA